MIEALQIHEILSLYQKYGWTLERVLLSKTSAINLSEQIEEIFGTAEIISSEIDAAWFSRASKNGGETWEIRHLSTTPYALLEVFEAEDDEDVREEILMEVEEKLKATLNKKKKENH